MMHSKKQFLFQRTRYDIIWETELVDKFQQPFRHFASPSALQHAALDVVDVVGVNSAILGLCHQTLQSFATKLNR